jgi:putative ABC transport system permease protein
MRGFGVATALLGDDRPGDVLHAVVAADGAIVSRSFAHRFGVRAGDTVDVESPHGPQRLRIANVTDMEPTAALILDRERVRKDWNDAFISWIRVALASGADPTAVSAAIARGLGQRYRLHILRGPELVEFYAGQVRQAFRGVYPMEAIIFLLVIVGLGDALAAGVLERTREFGMLRAVGISRAAIAGIVVLEGVAIGLLGLCLAAAAGIGLGLFWVKVQFPALLGWQLDLHFPSAFALSAAALTLAICVLAALAPALRAARLSVPTALRSE